MLANLTTRYPYHDARLFQSDDVPVDPTVAHPAFGNSFDWHSSVHSHWTAVELLGYFAVADGQREICERLREALVRNLTEAHVRQELAYLSAHPHYERPYGWAWLMRLAASLQVSKMTTLEPERAALRDLVELIAANAVRWLEQLPGPIRHGVHSNTAFALALMVEASATLGFWELEDVIAYRARSWFGGDRDYPQAWERSGNDFLSPGLAQADLLRRVLSAEDFHVWLQQSLPGLAAGDPILQVVDVPKTADGGIAHLHGLNLSRAGTLARIASTESGAARRLLDQADALYGASVNEAVHGDYLATHWLATFAWEAATSIDGARSRDERR